MPAPVPSAPPRAFAPLFEVERSRLLEMLTSLDAADWGRPSPCPGWTVLALATHLLGGDLSVLARQRDGHRGPPAPEGLSETGFIEWLDAFHAEWVHATQRLSPRLVVELLRWAGPQVAELVDHQGPSARTATVSWASDEPVPVWLDQARELSERWIHRQQLLQAVGRPSDLRADLTLPVLDGLRWAYPFRLSPLRRPAGATVTVTVTGPEVTRRWDLVSDGDRWAFGAPHGAPIAAVEASTDQAWRLLTNNFDRGRDRPVRASGDPEVVAALERTRAIIGVPKV